jgi:hypothetical protein
MHYPRRPRETVHFAGAPQELGLLPRLWPPGHAHHRPNGLQRVLLDKDPGRERDRVFCHQETGGVYRYDPFREALTAALTAAGVDAKLRPFHDLRHASLTNGAAAGESPIALMTRAGHASMSTTKRYLHLAGTTFPDEAAALAERMLGVSTEPSTRLSASQPISDDLASLNGAVCTGGDIA